MNLVRIVCIIKCILSSGILCFSFMFPNSSLLSVQMGVTAVCTDGGHCCLYRWGVTAVCTHGGSLLSVHMGGHCCLYTWGVTAVCTHGGSLLSVNAVHYVICLLMQIVYSSKKSGFVKLYVTATDKTEAADWVAALRQGNGVRVCLVIGACTIDHNDLTFAIE